jgi:hypothetical protein
VAAAGADIEDDDEPKVNGAPAGFVSGTAGGVLGAAPKENGEDDLWLLLFLTERERTE